MLGTFGDPILPIFAVMALGYVFAKAGFMDTGHAQAINRYVFYLAAPALGISVIGRADPSAISWGPPLVYFATEAVVYAAVFTVMRFVFRRETGEALLLGMTAVFANHVFFVLPIAEHFYPDAAKAISGIVLVDIAVVFCGSVLLAEIVTGSDGLGTTVRRLLTNPFVYAPPLGLLVGSIGDGVPDGVWTFLKFTSASAAPIVLFSLGITLAAAPIFPIRLPCWTVMAAKLGVVPLIVWTGLSALPAPLPPVPLLVAAGPCGAMPYVIASQYGIRTGTIAKTILLSTVISLASLAFLLP